LSDLTCLSHRCRFESVARLTLIPERPIKVRSHVETIPFPIRLHFLRPDRHGFLRRALIYISSYVGKSIMTKILRPVIYI
jgi:hypothetical protein